ncbi:MAG: acylphosphatase [Dehalococcoidales bacterium]|nr:acylphosphatase [Dehalococcoidales bacterium]
MAALASVRAVVYGLVQGVYFRAFILRHAEELGLAGYVRNLPGGGAVEIEAEGERKKLEKLLEHLKRGPPGAKVERVESNWSEYAGTYANFSIQY